MRHTHFIYFILATGLTLSAAPTVPTLTKSNEAIEFHGALIEPNDISGAVVVGDFLLVVSDEGKDPTVVQGLKKDGAGYRVLEGNKVKLHAGDKEVDLEGIAADGNMIYVTGSHCSSRKVEDGVIEKPKRHEAREQFFRFKLNPDGTHGPVEGKSLTKAIEADPVLKEFVGIASKENGIDIEGLAFKNGRLYFGFRGPVLHDGWVPILSCTWDDPKGSAKVLYVRLDGRGIRDLVAVEDGFLILAGPVGDGDGSYRLYFWNGKDHLPLGENGPKCERLGEFPNMGSGKPEGIAILKAENRHYELLLLCDGLPKGGPTRWKLIRP